jgi:signal transduction histidine kinase
MLTSGSTTFRPRARLIRLLGEELISDEVMAVVELVKNAFDADASTVVVRLHSVQDQERGVIEVVDDGIGMTLDTVLNAWLEPATSFKRRGGRKHRTAAGRYPLGEKGVGRFAADKLGAELELVTRGVDSEDEVRLTVSWGAFGEGDYLDEISNGWESRRPLQFASSTHGTLLRIDGLRVSWDPALVERVHEGLARLISPSARHSDFRIVLDCPDFPDFSGPVRNRLLETAPYRLRGMVRADGVFVSDDPDLDIPDVDLREHAGEHFRTRRGRGLRSPTCGPFSISLSAWDLDALGTGGVRMTRPLRAALKRANGVSIYRDGFRVAPYGDPGDDWLELNRRRVNNPTLRVSTNQVVGVVEITQEANADLRDRTSREGLIDHEALRDLKALVVAALSLLEESRYARRKAAAPEPPAPGVDPVLAYLDRARTEGGRRGALQAVEQAYRQFRTEAERREQSLLRLASAGAAAETLLGQLNGSVASLSRVLPLLERRLGDLPQIQYVRQSLALVTEQLDSLDRLRRPGERETTPVDLRGLVQDALTIFAPLLASTSVEATLDAPDQVVVRADRGATLQALLHVLENAIFEAARMTHHRWVEVLVRPGTSPCIVVRDSGYGVEAARRELIFDPFFTAREGRDGLGLFFARTLLRSCGHDLVLNQEGDQFLLTFDDKPATGARLQVPD